MEVFIHNWNQMFIFHGIISIPFRLLCKQCSLREKATPGATTSVGWDGIYVIKLPLIVRHTRNFTVNKNLSLNKQLQEE